MSKLADKRVADGKNCIDGGKRWRKGTVLYKVRAAVTEPLRPARDGYTASPQPQRSLARSSRAIAARR